VVAQVFQQLLAVLAFAPPAAAQVVLAEDDVVALAAELLDGGAGIDGVLDAR
jgi:hypothetical protein